MRGYKNRTDNIRRKRFNTFSGGTIWDSLSANIWKREFRSISNFHSNDWSSWTDEFNFSITWGGYKLAITAASLTAFFTGVGLLAVKLWG